MKNKILFNIGAIIILLFLIYTLTNGIIEFYNGYHNLDTAQNFIQLGYSSDITIDNKIITLQEAYLNGLRQMQNGFLWICFDVILALILGYLMRFKE